MTWFRVGGAGIPATLKNAMNAVFNKKFGTSGQNYPPKQWPDEVNLLGPLPEGTATGSIAHITDGAEEVPIKSWEVTLPASLDGYSSVDVVHCGKNLLPMVNYDGGVYNPDIGRQLSLTVSETQFTKNGNVYSVTTSVSWKAHTVLFPIISGAIYYEKWTLSVESGQQGSTRAYLDEDFKVLARYNSNSSDPIVTNGVMTPPTGAKYLAITWTNRGTAVQTLNITEPMIEIGSSASSWEEYTAPTQYTADLGRTIYGGTPDVVKGEGNETYARIDLGTLNYTLRNGVGMQSNGVSSLIQNPPDNYTKTTAIATDYTADTWQLVMGSGTSSGLFGVSGGYICFATTETDVATFKTSMSGKYLVFPLATPTDFTFTPITPTPETALGVNNFWADEGDTTVVYRRDIDLALQAVSSSRGLMMASRPVTQLIGEESDPDQVNELVEDDETEQEGEDNAR